MLDATSSTPTPQFGTAEYLGQSGNDHCQFCHEPVPRTYFRVNDVLACPKCAEKMRGELAKDTHAAYVRGILFGVGAAAAGLILYATFAIVTGIVIGYVSLAVGWMVGKAIIKGSGGVGGRRYQIAAVLLTYAAVSMAAIPIWIHYARAERKQQQTQQTQTQHSRDAEPRQSESGSGQPNQQPPEPAKPRMGLGGWLWRVALLGLASPFLEVWETGPNFGWIIGLVILFVGMKFAWRITAGRPLEIYGPFENTPQPAG
jgi:hypothetical protein